MSKHPENLAEIMETAKAQVELIVEEHDEVLEYELALIKAAFEAQFKKDIERLPEANVLADQLSHLIEGWHAEVERGNANMTDTPLEEWLAQNLRPFLELWLSKTGDAVSLL